MNCYFSDHTNSVLLTEGPASSFARSIIVSSGSHTLFALGNLEGFDVGDYVVEEYWIGPTSDCIDTGNDAYNSTDEDILRQDRILGSHIDMGAYENSSTP